MTRLETIKKELRTSIQGVYKFKETKKEVIDFYTKNESKLDSIKKETFNNYSFLTEVLQKCELKEKQSFNKKIFKKVIKLEVHRYAPELNKLHLFNNNTINTPKCTNIENAIAYVIKAFSINQLKNI